MKPKLLFLAHLLPWPLDGGGQIKSYHTLRILAAHFHITLLSFLRGEREAESVAALQPYCAGGVHLVRLSRGRAQDARAGLRALTSGDSLLIQRDDVPAMHRAVCDLLASREFAAIHVDHLQMMTFVPPKSEAKIRVVLDQHNVEHRILQRLAETASPSVRLVAAREWPRLRRFEQAACERADRVLAVSEEDAHVFREMLGTEAAQKVCVTPIGVDTDYFAPMPESSETEKTILTVGTMFWPPNVDGVKWFCAEILPRVRESLPEAQFVIAGARPSRAVRRLAGLKVTVTGTVPDVRPWMASCGVFVAPLRSGSGVRVKILNALAMGLPIVSTMVGAEGIDARDGEEILLADTPEAFAAAVVRVLTDTALVARLGSAGRELAVTRYSWERIAPKLLQAYREILP